MTYAASVSRDERLRVFLALRAPGDFLAAIERWQHDQLPNVRLVPRENLHITLAFLGSRPREELDALVAVLRGVAACARAIHLTPVRYRETRSAGMLVLEDEGGHAGALAADLHERLAQLQLYRRETRPWVPHLTVARWRERPRLHPESLPRRTFVPSDAAAYLSRLHRSGAEYRVLESVALGMSGGGE